MRFSLVVAAMASAVTGEIVTSITMPDGPVGSAPPLPRGTPQPPPPYAQGHANNERSRFAPDRHNITGPRVGDSGASRSAHISATNADGYWLSEFGPLGTSPFAPDGYQFFRNVKDFGAVGDGSTDDTEAINRAAAAFSISNTEDLRCGEDCGSTTTLSAVVYFPPGDYVISSPIIQYYYTQFVGNPEARARIVGSEDFEGIALFDANVYIPDGNGDQWYVNQSNFFRQIRNFVFDMTRMPRHNYQHDQEYVPAGIHWQVGQATSITNCHFEMPLSDAEGATTAIGIFMENGSGGTVDSLSFFGGNIGFLAGSQQFTASNLQFTLCLTAIRHEWNWGFVWKNIQVTAAYIAIDCTAFSETTDPPQGTGSITVLDSHFNGVPYGITLARQNNQQPNIVLENLLVENSESVVMISGGETLLPGSGGALYFSNWASGYQIDSDGIGGRRSGFMDVRPNKPQSLLENGRYFLRPKPQYPGTRPVVITEEGVSNDGTGDQSSAINRILSANVNNIVFFPAGVYLVEETIEIPRGARIIGSGWSTIMGTGSRFEDENDPHVMIRVGRPGDVGSVEITDMLFTVKGATAGAILMEWNIHEDGQGSAAMWDSHFRVGGNAGSDLLLDDCPARSGSVDRGCMAADMLLHMTPESSAYFYNVWVWVADHDLDDPNNRFATVGPGGIPENSVVEISVYAGRGVLIESQGPTWLWGCGSEHAQLYQWQLLNARNIFMGHMQTETPYYQAEPDALEPYETGSWPGDPSFDHCDEDDNICLKAWALRVINSTDIFLYGLGFYSFFDGFTLGCAPEEQCQQSLIETNYAGNLFMYNIFTKGNIEIVSPRGNLPPVWFNDTTRNGYTSNIAAYLALARPDAREIGSGDEDGSSGGTDIVYIDPIIWDTTGTPTIQCIPPCTYVLPPSLLDTPTTIVLPPITTSLEVGWFTPTTYEGSDGDTTTTTVFVRITQTTTLRPPPITTTRIEIWNEIIDDNVNSTVITARSSVPVPPFTVVDDPDPLDDGRTNPPVTRTITPPPWPWPTNEQPTTGPTSPRPTTTTSSTPGDDDDDDDDNDDDDDDIGIIPIVHTRGPPRPTCRGGGCGSSCVIFCERRCLLFCPPGSGGGADDGFIAPNNPNSPPPGTPTSSCEVETFSDCNTFCTATPTSTCTSSCSQVIGCDTTGTDIAATITPAPAGTRRPGSDWNTDEPFDNLVSSAQSVVGYLDDLGYFDLTAGPGGPGDDDDPGVCTSYLSTSICTTVGGSRSCTTDSWCSPTPIEWPPWPSVPSTAECSDTRDTCVRTTWFTRCFRSGEARATGAAGLDARAGPADTEAIVTETFPSPVAKKTSVPVAEERIAARAEESSEPSGNEPFVADTPAEQESSLEVAAVNTTWAELELLKRQDPACQVIPFCDLCARVFETPCLQFGIMTESRGSSVRVYVDIWEDGEYVCGFAAECSSSDTTDCDSGIIDCEGDRGAEFMMNRITYWNDDAGFGPVVNYLDLVVDDDIFLCSSFICTRDEWWAEQWCDSRSAGARVSSENLLELAAHRAEDAEYRAFKHF